MRITGGVWRSRALAAPRGTTTRPTSDRVREALFSMLVSDGLLGGSETEQGTRVLDLYAGSGALAFEALSRGATEAIVVEHGRDAIAAIQKNAQALGAESRVRILAAKVDRALRQVEGPFGVVFVDPPYADVPGRPFAEILAAAARLVAPGGALVLEHASTDPPPEVSGLEVDRSRRHGDTTLTLYIPAPKSAVEVPSST